MSRIAASLLTTTALAAVAAAVLGSAPATTDADSVADPTPTVEVVRRSASPTELGPPTLTAAAPAPRPAAARREPLAVEPLPTSTSPEGWTVAGGSSRDGIDEGGRTTTWTLEVEPSTGLAIDEVLRTAEAALYDRRSWARDHDLRRVADPADADVRVLVATPATVDRLCARAGLVTNGSFSCWNGRVAALNLARWERGATGFTDIERYRTYVVNHEVGHALGGDHTDCRGAGELADVMQQQTVTLAGCTANPWPHP